jgi:hypothetical protein
MVQGIILEFAWTEWEGRKNLCEVNHSTDWGSKLPNSSPSRCPSTVFILQWQCHEFWIISNSHSSVITSVRKQYYTLIVLMKSVAYFIQGYRKRWTGFETAIT